MCTGLRSGIEAAIHMANSTWNDESTEAMLFVDADNAFNRLNQLCPSLYTFLSNHYQCPSDLIVSNHSSDPLLLSSEEGSTQGDVLAMAMYALDIKPLMNELAL